MKHIEEPKISVAMATYNGEKYIKEQLESILKQTFVPDEIIICDDNSNDNTIGIIDNTLKKEDIKYSVIKHERNEGVVKTFKEALKASTGDYVFLCDQDDYWYTDKVERFIDVFKRSKEINVILSDANITDEKLVKQRKTLWETLKFYPQNKDYNSLNEYIKKEMFKRNIFTGMCMCVRKSWLDNLPDYSNFMLHDEFMGWNALIDSSIYLLQKSTAAYRQHNNNAVGAGKHKKYVNKKQFKEAVKKSNIRTLNKFENLELLFQNNRSYNDLVKAINFYQYRIKLFSWPRLIKIKKFLIEYSQGNYSKFCSSTEHAVLKDLAICLL